MSSVIVIALAVIGGVALFTGLMVFFISLHELFERVDDIEKRLSRHKIFDRVGDIEERLNRK